MLGTFWPHIHPITAISFTDDDDALITAASDASIFVHRLADILDSQRPPSHSIDPSIRLSGHTLPVTDLSVGFAGISARVVSVADDRTVRIWHLASATCLSTLLLDATPSQIALSIDETMMVVALRNGSVVLLDVTLLEFGTTRAIRKDEIIPRPATASGEQLQATAVVLAPSGTHVIVGYSDGVVRLYDTFSFAFVHAYTKHSTTAPVTFVAALPSLQTPDPAQIPAALARTNTRSEDADHASAPLVSLKHTSPLLASVWSYIGCASQEIFLSERIVLMDESERILEQAGITNGGQSHDRTSQDPPLKDAVLEKILEEVQFLRRRNLQLEEAGRKLLNIVRKHGT